MAGKGKKARVKLSPEEKQRRRLMRPSSSDFGPIEPLERGERKIEPLSDKGAPRRAINVSRLDLTDQQEAAAAAIDLAYRTRTAGLFSKAQNYERVDRGAQTDHMATTVMDAIAAYLDWVKRAGRKRADIVISHVVDGNSCAEIEREKHLRHGSAAQVVRAELDEMARIMPDIAAKNKRLRRRQAA